MTHVVFYEKPGCGGNAKQKAWLESAGHTLDVRSLLAWPWTADSLLAFLAPLPVAEWFNRAAPRVKSGEVVPEQLDRDSRPGPVACRTPAHPPPPDGSRWAKARRVRTQRGGRLAGQSKPRRTGRTAHRRMCSQHFGEEVLGGLARRTERA
jgi:hypothetical protein